MAKKKNPAEDIIKAADKYAADKAEEYISTIYDKEKTQGTRIVESATPLRQFATEHDLGTEVFMAVVNEYKRWVGFPPEWMPNDKEYVKILDSVTVYLTAGDSGDIQLEIPIDTAQYPDSVAIIMLPGSYVRSRRKQ